ncbi:hypothetical protein FXO37_00006 [Capsicum annuum]|nr:hypothetical protein FXO37_00006 [Capsicum annuum]
MDVKIAFLNGNLEEEVYMNQLEGFSIKGKEHMVCKLKKSIYGLKQAFRQWYLKFNETIVTFGFKENTVDRCIYLKVSGNLVGYSDSDYAGFVDTRKSTFGYLFLLAGGAISWKSVKQYVIDISTMKAEFVICFETTVQTNWLRHFISVLRLVDNIARPLKIYCDNTAVVFFSKNDKYSKDPNNNVKAAVALSHPQFVSSFEFSTSPMAAGDSRLLNSSLPSAAAAKCGHYCHANGDNSSRSIFMVTQKDLDDTFNPPFKSCVLDGNVASVICSFNHGWKLRTYLVRITMVGSYEGSPCKYTTPLDGLVAVVSTVYQQGCDIACATTQVDKAKKVVAAADAVVLVMGSYQTIERESHDRVNLTLSGTRKEKSKWVGGGKV